MATSLQEETLIVANDYMDFCIGIKKAPPSEAAKAMRYLGKDVERIYGFRLRPLVQFLLDSSGINTWTQLRSVMMEVIGREAMSWGQIVSLFSFTGILAVQLSTGEDDVACSRRLAELLTEVLLTEKEEWMVQNGGWVRKLLKRTLPGFFQSSFLIFRKLPGTSGVSLGGS
ncbi:anti-apoptotic protein NR13-like [Brienomyrus brachyistius]|uniref:anti-apoptotic protein NR13-like n=1 Tax=Brienomyrus brachyistius TaxID=42636 RepID=UPI0020B3A25B|nr:anti-apoptotic protein NR13-like [Brienomyrus brachyistius]XP_048837638.1 anti-apoptotic protein NR13-like [Brienomyrus brachyistius]